MNKHTAMTLKLSRYHVVTPPFADGADEHTKRVVFATRTAEVRVLSAAAWDHLAAGAIKELPDELRDELAAAELLVPAGEDELAAVLARNRSAAERSDVLAVVIQPTAYCQLGCGYCGQEHLPKWVNPGHQDAFIERLRLKLSTGRFRRLDVSWFGAEPLSGIQVMRAFTPRLKALAASFDCAYSAAITTNGFALSERVGAELVEEHAVRTLHVTLDGVAEFHDARRHLKSGRPTFDRIFANVVALARREDLDVEIKIRANVDRHNCAGVSPLIKMLAEAGLTRRVQFYAMPIHSWGNDAQRESLSPEEFASREIEWLCEMFRLGFPLGVVPAPKPVVCLAVHPEGELLDATGTLFNCTEVSYVPAYGTPNRFALGHVTTGEVPGRRNLLGDFNERVGRGEYPCTSCRMLPVCGGACPKAWMEGHEPCPSAKRNIESRLLLAYAMVQLHAARGRTETPDQTPALWSA